MARRARLWTGVERLALLEELEASGLSVAAFARERGISAWTIYSWRRQERERAAEEESSGPFVRLRIAASREEHVPLAVELNGGVRVHVPAGFDEGELRRLLEVLGSC